MATRQINVDTLARVEGEGALRIQIVEDQIGDVQLNIYEPPRFFEGFLQGRGVQETVDITARICGICPVAYQMSAAHALEKALGMTPPPGVRPLRRLLYLGEWIESHGLHVYMLHAPDFVGHRPVSTRSRSTRSAVSSSAAVCWQWPPRSDPARKRPTPVPGH